MTPRGIEGKTGTRIDPILGSRLEVPLARGVRFSVEPNAGLEHKLLLARRK
jgi:hypothetical protein